MSTKKIVSLAGAVGLAALLSTPAGAYPRYNSGCQNCHGKFDGGVSPKGTQFPSDDKHEMHRNGSFMATDCNLCHTKGDNRNPFLGSSDGTNDTPGFGCTGCHGRAEDAGNDSVSAGLGAGLRQHHVNSGVTVCATCHMDANPSNYTPVGEDVPPPYYGSVDTNVDDPCNRPPDFLENWSTGDTAGTDNDGDRIYDEADPDCVPEPGTWAALAGALALVALRRRRS